VTPQKFCESLEGYFARRYTGEQRTEIARWTKSRSARVLQIVYRHVVAEETFLPLVATLNRALEYAFDAYPELEPFSAAAQAEQDRKAITDDAGWTQDDIDRALAELRAVVEPVANAHRFRFDGADPAGNGADTSKFRGNN
jgi:hypothetical protein